jgi:hypothetical protein
MAMATIDPLTTTTTTTTTIGTPTDDGKEDRLVDMDRRNTHNLQVPTLIGGARTETDVLPIDLDHPPPGDLVDPGQGAIIMAIMEWEGVVEAMSDGDAVAVSPSPTRPLVPAGVEVAVAAPVTATVVATAVEAVTAATVIVVPVAVAATVVVIAAEVSVLIAP